MSKGLLLGGGALMLCLLLIIFIAVIYFLTRPEKESEKEKETDETPTVSGAGVDLVLNPADKPDNVEEYSIFKTEYALGDASAKNIDIKLKWTNGPTFATVDSLFFVHQNQSGTKVRDDVTTTGNTDSNASNELLFKG